MPRSFDPIPPPPRPGGSYNADNERRLQNANAELQTRLGRLEDEARRTKALTAPVIFWDNGTLIEASVPISNPVVLGALS